jgi:hypothetical protein
MTILLKENTEDFWNILLMKCEWDLTQAGRIKVKGAFQDKYGMKAIFYEIYCIISGFWINIK